jgi:hypothetical protein
MNGILAKKRYIQKIKYLCSGRKNTALRSIIRFPHFPFLTFTFLRQYLFKEIGMSA